MEWTECCEMPMGMFQAQAVFLKGRIYIGGGNTGNLITDALVIEYNPRKDTWTPLPANNSTTSFGLCKLGGELIAVGGVVGVDVISTVVVFDSLTKRWKESLPPMDVARQSPNCLSVKSAIIVCGGVSCAGELLSSIEVIKSDTFQWYTAGYLSRSAILSHSSPLVIYDSIYLLGGYKSSTANSCSNAAHSSPIDLLLSYSGVTPFSWYPMPATPHFQSTAACIGSCLVSLGGTSSPYTSPVHRSIHAFSHSSNSWIYVGDLPYAFCHGTALSLPNNEIYVMGGWVEPGRFKRSCKVYKGCVRV